MSALSDAQLQDSGSVEPYCAYIALQATRPITDPTSGTVGRALRPSDEQLCIWVDEQDATRLMVSTDMATSDLSTAMQLARVLAEEAVALFPEVAILASITVYGEVLDDGSGEYETWTADRADATRRLAALGGSDPAAEAAPRRRSLPN